MAGVSIDTGGKGGKKNTDFAVNLVPFIDLLSSLIAFLMMTAVWTQVGRLQVATGGGVSESTDTPKPTLQLNLTITERGYVITAGGVIEVPKKDGSFDLKGLGDKLKSIKADNPDQRNITVMAEDAIAYEDLVRVVDMCIEQGLPDVSVQAAM
jgi:biopolymer transport protein ExbD